MNVKKLLLISIIIFPVFIFAQTQHFAFTANTGESYSLVIDDAFYMNSSLEVGDEIGVFTPAGLCVGASVWTGSVPLALIAWADDSQTQDVDGYVPAELMTFKIWINSQNFEHDASPDFTQGNGTFGDGVFSRLTMEVVVTLLPAIFVESPNGDESMESGSQYNITWSNINFTDSVGIAFSSNSGTDFTEVTAITANTGTYSWTVPNIPTTRGRIRIFDAKDGVPADSTDGDFTITANAVTGTTYYVSPSGNDSNPGTEAQPWKTIQNAANTLSAGDRVFIKAGIYNEMVEVPNSGSAGNYIVFESFPGDTAIIDGAGIDMPEWESGLFHIEDQNYIRVTGLKVMNAGPNDNNCAIYTDNASHIIIENNTTYNTTSSGIGVWNGTDIIIAGNEVELACNDGEQECITVGEANTFEVYDNHVHHGGPGSEGGEGICLKDGSYNGKVYNNHVHDFPDRLGIYIDAWDKHTYDIDIFDNLSYNCGGDGITLTSEQGGFLENINVYNNIVYNNKNIGISITPNGPASKPPMRNIRIINNTCFNNGWDGDNDPWGGGITAEIKNMTGLIIRNNILSQNLTFQMAIEYYGTNYSVDHNLIDGFRGELDEETYGSDYVEGDPMFVNSAAADFHLQGNSPAINMGSSSDAPASDYDGNLRPQGGVIDLGAYEYVTTSVREEAFSHSHLTFSLHQNYPNPFNPETVIGFTVKDRNRVVLTVFDLLGHQVMKLVDREYASGKYQVTFEAGGIPSGIYFYQIRIGNFKAVKKMTILR